MKSLDEQTNKYMKRFIDHYFEMQEGDMKRKVGSVLYDSMRRLKKQEGYNVNPLVEYFLGKMDKGITDERHLEAILL